VTDVIRVIQFGLGPIGSATARLVAERENLELVGAVDIHPDKVGRDVGEAIGLGRTLGIAVARRLGEVGAEADVVVHTTSSYFDQFLGQVLEILEAGLDVVSTSEELSFPWRYNAELAAAVDAAARRAGKTVLGTGVNPGFLMDSLPLFITAISQRVDHIAVARVIDASKRRGPFQAKIGCGMTEDEFRTKMAEGRMGHVGLPESAAMLCDTLGRELVRFENTVEPVLATEPVRTEFFDVPAGRVRGLHQTGRGYAVDGEFVSLTFRAALDEAPDGDTITVSGRPDLTVRLQGTNGDLTTVAMAVNAIRRTRNAAPGLVTMRDIPIVTAS
jgi:4-hydroxy-tetrahydrodipicolinate reductase